MKRPSVSRNCVIYSSFDADVMIVKEKSNAKSFTKNLGGAFNYVNRDNKTYAFVFDAGKMMRCSFTLFLVLRVSFVHEFRLTGNRNGSSTAC